MNKLQIQNLCFGYYRGPLVLNDVSFDIFDGDKILVLASEGMGKSTLLSVLSGFEKSYFGNILYNGVSLKKYDDEKLNFSFLPTNPVFFEQKTIKQNFDYFCDCLKIDRFSQEELKNKIDGDFDVNKKIKMLTLKEKQKLAFLRSKIKNPDICFADDTEIESEDDFDNFYESLFDENHTSVVAFSDSSFKIVTNKLKDIKFSKIIYLIYGKNYIFDSLKEFEKSMVSLNQTLFFDCFNKISVKIVKDDGNYYFLDEMENFVLADKKFYSKLDLLKLENSESEDVQIVFNKNSLSEFELKNINEMLKKNQVYVFSSLTSFRVI